MHCCISMSGGSRFFEVLRSGLGHSCRHLGSRVVHAHGNGAIMATSPPRSLSPLAFGEAGCRNSNVFLCKADVVGTIKVALITS